MVEKKQIQQLNTTIVLNILRFKSENLHMNYHEIATEMSKKYNRPINTKQVKYYSTKRILLTREDFLHDEEYEKYEIYLDKIHSDIIKLKLSAKGHVK